jgi:hypothetical protein
VAIILLAVGFLASTTVAVVEFVQLRAAREEIEELEAGAEARGGGGVLGDLGEIFEDAFGELGESLGGADDPAGLLGCLLPDRPFSGQPVGDVPLEQAVRTIAGQVEDLRELEFTEPVHPVFVSPEESAARVQDLFLEEYTEDIGDAEGRLLIALGAVPPGTDLRALRSEILGQQVAGFYDPETGELVIRHGGADLTLMDRVVLAHELDHALTDQVLGIPLPDDLRTGQEDGDLARTALVEGDATLLMQLYAASVPFGDQVEGLDPSAIGEAIRAQADLAEMPPYLAAEMTFPYEEGLAFVCDLYRDGGWAAVDQAYRAPPDSSVEILAPELYSNGFEPVDPRDPGTLRRPWRRLVVSQLGAAQLLWLFEAPGGRTSDAVPNAGAAAGAWAGGEIHLWEAGADSALGISLVERPGENGLCRAAMGWYRAAFDDDREQGDGRLLRAVGGRQDAEVRCHDDEVRVGIGPTLETARALSR